VRPLSSARKSSRDTSTRQDDLGGGGEWVGGKVTVMSVVDGDVRFVLFCVLILLASNQSGLAPFSDCSHKDILGQGEHRYRYI
jgi:hypothetical protein